MRVCSRCKLELPDWEFHSRTETKMSGKVVQGLQNKCKSCSRLLAKRYAAARRAKLSE